MQPEKLYLRQDSLFDSKWIDSVEEYAKNIQQKKLVIQDGKQTETKAEINSLSLLTPSASL